MGRYQDSMLSAWKAVNTVTASMHLTGAAPAFRQAIAATDFASLVPAFEFGNFKVYVLDWLEGQMVYVDSAREFAVVGRYLWTIMSTHFPTLDSFVDDLSAGASGVKVIDYDSGPYREAGHTWRKMNEAMTPPPNALDALEQRLGTLLERANSIRDAGPERSNEQYQALFSEIAGAEEQAQELQERLDKMKALLDFTRGTVYSI
jgi:hypothetical protein